MIRGRFLPGSFALLLVLAFLFAAGCTTLPGPGSAPSGTGTGVLSGPGGCKTPEECATYCAASRDACDTFCTDHPDICSRFARDRRTGGPMAGTACDTDTVKTKMNAVIDRVLVAPPVTRPPPNWMTKILPADNPYPGYYYDISVAFGPAIDAQNGVAWSGEGEPPRAPGLDYYTVGVWDERPKGSGASLGEQSPESLDLSRYQLAVFYTNVSAPSQAAMINSLPDLTMSEAEAKAFFASKIKTSFIDLDGKTLTRSGPKMYEVRWHDSENTQDYWDVQIGTGYIAIGQGKVYTEESLLQGDPGTMWRFHACRPCINCADWTKETTFNHDCSTDTDCIGGLSCSRGYCVKPGTGSAISGSTSGTSTMGKGPGASCSSAADCGSGLSCTNNACTIPMGR